MNEQFKERVKYYTEWLRALLIIGLTDISGVVSLMSKNDHNAMEFVFLIFGFFSIFALGIGIAIMCMLILKYIKKI